MSKPTRMLDRRVAGEALPDGVLNFDALPSSARINSRCLKILLGVGETTFWRRRKNGLIPEPDRFGTWSVGQVRALLSGDQEAA